MFGPIENDAADIERSIESFASVPNSGQVLLPGSTLIDELTVRIDRGQAMPGRERDDAIEDGDRASLPVSVIELQLEESRGHRG